MSSIVTPFGRGWDVGGAWWGTSACWEPGPLVLMDVGYWIWTWGCGRLGFTSTGCGLASTLIWGAHNRWREDDCWCCGREEAFLAEVQPLSDVAAAAICVVSGTAGTEGVAVTTGTIGMTAMGTCWGGRDGGGGAGGWCGCWQWASSPQVTWLTLSGWEVTSSTHFDSVSLLMCSFSLRCSSSARNNKCISLV